jgi:hypothetical protein
MSTPELDITHLAVRIDPGISELSELAAEAPRLRRVHVDEYVQVLIDADPVGVRPSWHKA